MKTVELIYDHDCPNVERTRFRLLKAFAETGSPARWVEWEKGDSFSPLHVRAYGSPTVLIDGRDIAGSDPTRNISCCRIYPDGKGGFDGAPSVEMIADALRSPDDPAIRGNGRSSTKWSNSLAVLLGIGASLLPVGACPACWPAYAGLLSSFGFGFLLDTTYLLPLTVLFLVMAVAALAYKAKTRRGYGPFVMGIVAAVIVFCVKFVYESDLAMYGGIVLLITASLWNAWPRKKVGADHQTCPSCASKGQVS